MSFKPNQLVWVFGKYQGLVVKGDAYKGAKVNVKYKGENGIPVIAYVDPKDLKERTS